MSRFDPIAAGFLPNSYATELNPETGTFIEGEERDGRIMFIEMGKPHIKMSIRYKLTNHHLPWITVETRIPASFDHATVVALLRANGADISGGGDE